MGPSPVAADNLPHRMSEPHLRFEAIDPCMSLNFFMRLEIVSSTFERRSAYICNRRASVSPISLRAFFKSLTTSGSWPTFEMVPLAKFVSGSRRTGGRDEISLIGPSVRWLSARLWNLANKQESAPQLSVLDYPS